MNSTLAKNLETLSKRFPALAERLASTPLPQIQKAASQDGGYCYAHQNNEGKWQAITNPVDPIAKAQQAVQSIEDRIGNGFAPAVVIGLDPGYTLEIIYKHFKENYYDKYINRRIYVILDSTACLYGWLNSEDRTDMLNNESIELYWHTETKRIVRLCKRDEMRSHLFIPVSTLPEASSAAIMEPLAKLFVERQEEEKRLLEDNNKYYSKQTDKELDKIIQGKAGRKPRMLIPSHASSTVVQYSVRDTAAMFEKEGWEVRIMNMKTDLSCWRVNKNISDFKPDIYLLVNHLRTEDTAFYPKDMMFVTWVQDTVSYINNSENAKIWNKHVKSKKKRRDLIIGYVGQVKQYGYQEDRLTECPMIVNQDLFKARDITPEERAKYECDICFASNRSKETFLIVKEDLTPKLDKYGFNEDILMKIHDHLWEYYREEKTCVGYIQLEDKIIELPEVCSLIEKLINKDDHDFIIQRIYWELNDVIYRHIVLEWISEMKDTKLHLYGRGWENHPKFSKYARGILKHGEELSLAYQCAKYCLHLNSLEGEHQRLSEITDAKSNPLTRLSIDKEILERQKLICEGCNDLSNPNIHFINTLWNTSLGVLKQFPKSRFHKKLNKTLINLFQNIKIKLLHQEIAITGKKDVKERISTLEPIHNVSSKNTALYQYIFNFISGSNKLCQSEIIPLPISSFLFKLIESMEANTLPGFSKLQSNLIFKAILFEQKEKQKKAYLALAKLISFTELCSEVMAVAVNFKLDFEEDPNIQALVEKTYQNNDKLYDLNFRIAIKSHMEDENWYKIALKDISDGRLTLKAAGHLATLSVKWGNEQEVTDDIIKYFSIMRDYSDVDSLDLLPILSQILKLSDKEPLERIVVYLKQYVPNALLAEVVSLAKTENGLNTDFENTGQSYESLTVCQMILLNEEEKARSLFNKTEHSEKMMRLAQNMLLRNHNEKFLKIYNFLIMEQTKLNQSQVNLILSTPIENHLLILQIIENLYKSDDDICDLYFTYARKNPTERDQIQYGLRDFRAGRLTMKNLSLLVRQLPLKNPKKEITDYILLKFTKAKKINLASATDNYSIISRMIRFTGREKVISVIEKSDLCKIETFKYGFKAALVEENPETTPDESFLASNTVESSYCSLLKGDIQNTKNKLQVLEITEINDFLNILVLNNRSQNAFELLRIALECKLPISDNAITAILSNCENIDSDICVELIDKIYNSNDQILDLYFAASRKAFTSNEDLWYQFFKADLFNKRLSLNAASIICTQSAKTKFELKVINNLIEYFDDLKELNSAKLHDLIPIFSQIQKITGPEAPEVLLGKLSELLPDNDIYTLRLITQMENGVLPLNYVDISKIKKSKWNHNGLIYLRSLSEPPGTFDDLEENEYKDLIRLSENAFFRKIETAYLKAFERIPWNYLILDQKMRYLQLVRDYNFHKTMEIFASISKKEWSAHCELEYNLTKLLWGKEYHLNKPVAAQNGLEKTIYAILLSELEEHDQALKALPEKTDEDTLGLCMAIVYMRASKVTESKNILVLISKEIFRQVKDKDRNALIKSLRGLFSLKRQTTKNLLILQYILFRLLNPNKDLSIESII